MRQQLPSKESEVCHERGAKPELVRRGARQNTGRGRGKLALELNPNVAVTIRIEGRRVVADHANVRTPIVDGDGALRRQGIGLRHVSCVERVGGEEKAGGQVEWGEEAEDGRGGEEEESRN